MATDMRRRQCVRISALGGVGGLTDMLAPHPYGGGYGTAAPNMGPQAYYGGNTGGLQAPPSNPQHFDNRLGNQYNFQYSNCSGRRKALLIGINYYGTSNELRGCINDVHNMRQFLNRGCACARPTLTLQSGTGMRRTTWSSSRTTRPTRAAFRPERT